MYELLVCNKYLSASNEEVFLEKCNKEPPKDEISSLV